MSISSFLLALKYSRWPDGSPVLYNNFEEATSDEADPTVQECAYIDSFNCFQWERYDCMDNGRATICQTGRLLKSFLATRIIREINSSKKVWKSEFDRLFLPSLSNNRCMFDTIRKKM